MTNKQVLCEFRGHKWKQTDGQYWLRMGRDLVIPAVCLKCGLNKELRETEAEAAAAGIPLF